MPAEQNYANDIATTVQGGGINNSSTALTVASGTGFPTAPFTVRVDDELMLVSSTGAGTNWTVSRGAESTVAAAHSAGAAVNLTLSRDALLALAAKFMERGTSGAQPAATGLHGFLYAETDTGLVQMSDGTNWVNVADLMQWYVRGVAATSRPAQDLYGPAALVDDSSNGRTQLRVMDKTVAYIRDDFLGGTTTSGAVGDLRWTLTTTTATLLAGTANHPGQCRFNATATAATTFRYAIPRATTPIHSSADFELVVVMQFAIAPGSNTVLYIGLGDGTTALPANGIGFEKKAADTQWFGNCRTASAESRSTALATCDSNWHTFKARKVGSTVYFSIDGGTEYSVASNVPSAAMTPYIGIGNNNVASDQQIVIDLYELCLTGLSR